MQGEQFQPSRVRKTVNDLVMAEMFLLQATLESATAIGEGLGSLGKQINAQDDELQRSWSNLSAVLQRTADEAVEPYTTRYRYFRKMISTDQDKS
ncbi:MAG: hypothetical protein ACI9NT_002058 [Bacteroidia bacterium]|jgi:hypothetical protein